MALHDFGQVSQKETAKEEDRLDVSNREFIREFLENIELSDAKLIQKEIKRINEIGLPDKYHAKCENCEHEWEAEVNFNPTNFFTDT